MRHGFLGIGLVGAQVDTAWYIVIGIAVILALFAMLMLRLIRGLYQAVGPNRALIVSGMNTGQNGKVVTNGGTFVFPMFQRVTELSLEMMSFDVVPEQDLYTSAGVPVSVEAVTQLQVKSDESSILTHAQQFANISPESRQGMIKMVMEGHLRGIVGQLNVEDLVTAPETVNERMRELAAADMANMGLKIVTFTIRDVHDRNQYITNMGFPAHRRKQADRDIADATLTREVEVRRAEELRLAAEKAARENMERVRADTEGKAKQSEYDNRLKMRQADLDNELKTHVAEIAQLPEIEAAKQRRLLAETETHTQEALMRQKEMEYQVSTIAAANVDAQRLQLMARAEQQREIIEAEGRAIARRKVAEAEAEATRLTGSAEAKVILAKGEAEAEALRMKADAYGKYGEAAILDRVVGQLPDVVKALTAPFERVEKISIISTGGSDGDGLGATRLTNDVLKVAGQVQGLLEAITGYNVPELIKRIPGLNVIDAAPAGQNGNSHTSAPPAGHDGGSESAENGNATTKLPDPPVPPGAHPPNEQPDPGTSPSPPTVQSSGR